MLIKLILTVLLGLGVCCAMFTDVTSQMLEMHNAHAARVDTAANEISIVNFAFQPATLTVKAGTKVTWINHDDEPHTATATDKRFNSKTLDNGGSFSMQFDQPGTYNYYCALHPHMTGQIIVK